MNDERETAAYDSSLGKMEKKWMPGQAAFYIMSYSLHDNIYDTQVTEGRLYNN